MPIIGDDNQAYTGGGAEIASVSEVASLADSLTGLGLEPILVGGMAALRVASEDDLLRLKKIARIQRSAPGDAEDVAFLEARRKRRPKV